ncbi:MAG: hypothetical protein SO016_07160 [Lachnospiraceae bacterium]|nr:hypothetical protein [Lachnospiraceae bacterium]
MQQKLWIKINNMGIRYKGIDLVYSKSIDYFAYPGIDKMTEQRGATMIDLNEDGSYTLHQLHHTR